MSKPKRTDRTQKQRENPEVGPTGTVNAASSNSSRSELELPESLASSGDAKFFAAPSASELRWQPRDPGEATVAVFDVAAFILDRVGTITAMKLQKLVYYAQAWSLVWDEKPLFNERIRAWANGPVVPVLYRWHKGSFEVSACVLGDSTKLNVDQRETLDAVLGYYGSKASQWLSDLTHQEKPWRDARKGLAPGEPGSREISHASLAEYYGAL